LRQIYGGIENATDTAAAAIDWRLAHDPYTDTWLVSPYGTTRLTYLEPFWSFPEGYFSFEIEVRRHACVVFHAQNVP
jgi:hypothetical protein